MQRLPFCGTTHYFAPEVIEEFRKGQFCGRQADAWSLGVVLYVMLAASPPWEEEHLYEQIPKARYGFDGAPWLNISSEAKEVVRNFIKLNPEDRLTVHGALNCEWLRFKGMSDMARLTIRRTL